MNREETKFAPGSEGLVAYQVWGEGPVDLMFVPPWHWNIEVMWEEPRIERVLNALGAFCRVIAFDKRGSGVSDHVPLGALPTLEQWSDDILCVMDAVGSKSAAIVGNMEGAQMALLFAATHPQRTRALVMIDGAACYVRSDDYPIGYAASMVEATAKAVYGLEADRVALFSPSLAGDEPFRRWWRRFERLSVPPSASERIFIHGTRWDVRAALSTIQVPTTVIHRAGNKYMPAAFGRYVAEHIAGAKYVELEGADGQFFAGDTAAIVGEIRSLLTGIPAAPEHDRVLATVLFTDMVGSTRKAAELGDSVWLEVLEFHYRVSREQAARYQGRVVQTTGDGVLAMFDGPTRAIRCSAAIAAELARVGVEIRCGLHTGEVTLRGQDIGGIAVHLAARVMSQANAGEVLVSGTVKDLVIGSGIDFEDRDIHELKGIPGSWPLFAARLA